MCFLRKTVDTKICNVSKKQRCLWIKNLCNRIKRKLTFTVTLFVLITRLHYEPIAVFVPKLVGSHLAQLIELDFFGEDIERDVDRAT